VQGEVFYLETVLCVLCAYAQVSPNSLNEQLKFKCSTVVPLHLIS